MLEKIRAKLEKALADNDALVALAFDENRELTTDEQAVFDENEVIATRCAAEIDRLRKSAEARRAAADASVAIAASGSDTRHADPETVTRATRGATVPAEPAEKLTGQQMLGISCWAVARAKQYPATPPLDHLDAFGMTRIADKLRAHKAEIEKTRANLSTTVGGGANVIDTPLSADFIEFLRNESVFLSSGPVAVDLSYGSLKIPGGNVGATGTYSAEGADLGYTQMTTRTVDLQAKHLGAVTAMGTYLIEVSPLAMASVMGDDLQMGLTLAIDAAGLRGSGTGNNPAGVFTLVNAAHKFAVGATTATPTLAQTDAEIKKALSFIRASNVPNRRRRWIMSNRVFTHLQFLRDGNGNKAYPGLSLAAPTLENIPVSVSEQVPSNLGAGTDESEIYLIDFGHVLIGEARSLRLKASDEASYLNAGGTLVSSFSKDETVIRGTASHDFDMRHDRAAVVVTGVRWGA